MIFFILFLAKERPKLQLKPRSVPLENNAETSGRSSIFGGAKPVDTAAKEKEIEEKLEKLKVEPDMTKRTDFRSTRERAHSGDGEFRSRRDSNRSSDGDRGSHGRRDSEKSLEKEPNHTDKESPQPTVNVWKQRMESQKTSAEDDKKPPSDESQSKPSSEKPLRNNTETKTSFQSDAPSSRGAPSRPYSRGGERGATRGRGRGRGRGDFSGSGRQDLSNSSESRNKDDKRERKERKPAEPKIVDEQPPVGFHFIC